MSKTPFYKWFGLRKIPEADRRRLSREVIRFDEEGCSCSLGYRKFRGTHKRSSWGFQGGVTGSLLITTKSFYVRLPYMIHCDNPVEEAVKYIQLELKSDRQLKMNFMVDKLFENSSGELSCTWRTENAPAIYQHLIRMQKGR